jgi:hypothetical protein
MEMLNKKILLAAAAALGLSLSACGVHAQTTGGNTGALIGGDGVYIFKTLPMASGGIVVGQGAASDPVIANMSGDCTMNASAVVTCTKTNGANLGTAAAVNTGTSGNTLGTLSSSKTDSGALNTYLGHVAAGTAAPTLSSCGGGSPVVLGDDKDGEITLGTSTAGCTLTFATAYTSKPLCTVTWQANLAAMGYTPAAGTLTLTQTSASSNKVNYHCTAQNGG